MKSYIENRNTTTCSRITASFPGQSVSSGTREVNHCRQHHITQFLQAGCPINSVKALKVYTKQDTKLKVYNISQNRQRRTEPMPHSMCRGNLVKFSHVVLEICEFTDRQRNILITIFRGQSNEHVINTHIYNGLSKWCCAVTCLCPSMTSGTVSRNSV